MHEVIDFLRRDYSDSIIPTNARQKKTDDTLHYLKKYQKKG